ncbi:hypothetical protein [Sphingobium scionense]|uniref:Uncharacterized protein n=1 Tax=Sphingobium scionense TaxID=1404341 RepID=A0A7W6PV42_9SPHN|nr:hypothetical protein [Sphingobium scionense]MBB4147734.1 hypothetical protein [Sphingobium scionense]
MTDGRCGCIAALPAMFALLSLFVARVIGDCHIDAGDMQCAAGKRQASVILILTPIAGIATFFLVRWLIGRRK